MLGFWRKKLLIVCLCQGKALPLQAETLNRMMANLLDILGIITLIRLHRKVGSRWSYV